ncbi:hypothetical protein FRZ00_02035 [Streptomyces mobaraensis]|uniref:Uncharacterized protein n=1 Tax=Streptomyces mobaraensis TaxID=35621 RepID=A0A5N5WEW0_STRMB|nr:hypothetical protein FRZ00_02035 [Streptomyces mobaraensis]
MDARAGPEVWTCILGGGQASSWPLASRKAASEREHCAALRGSVRWHEPDAALVEVPQTSGMRGRFRVALSIFDLLVLCRASRAGMVLVCACITAGQTGCGGVPLQRVSGRNAAPLTREGPGSGSPAPFVDPQPLRGGTSLSRSRLTAKGTGRRRVPRKMPAGA